MAITLITLVLMAITLVHWVNTLKYVAITLVHFRVQTADGLLERERKVKLLKIRMQQCSLKKTINQFLVIKK